MTGNAARRAALLLGVAMALGACSHRLFHTGNDDDSDINTYPATYKADILAAMHVYLNDPTGIRDAAVSPPILKQVAGETRYLACVRFNPKKNSTDYAGIKELAAVFLVGLFDHFVDIARDADASKNLCVGAAYAPFPELQSLPP
ncbi:MAG: hypothetical protein WA280_18860 [Xanthobacteraceae bacterium]